MVFHSLRAYVSSSIPCFKTLNLPALERARSSLCLVLKASALREAFLDPPTLNFFKSTITVKKYRKRSCSQSAFTLLQNTFSGHLLLLLQPATSGATSPWARLAAGPRVPERQGTAERNGEHLIYTHRPDCKNQGTDGKGRESHRTKRFAF